MLLKRLLAEGARDLGEGDLLITICSLVGANTRPPRPLQSVSKLTRGGACGLSVDPGRLEGSVQ